MLKLWYILKELWVYLLLGTILILSVLLDNTNDKHIIESFIKKLNGLETLFIITGIIFVKCVISGLIKYGKEHQRKVVK